MSVGISSVSTINQDGAGTELEMNLGEEVTRSIQRLDEYGLREGKKLDMTYIWGELVYVLPITFWNATDTWRKVEGTLLKHCVKTSNKDSEKLHTMIIYISLKYFIIIVEEKKIKMLLKVKWNKLSPLNKFLLP